MENKELVKEEKENKVVGILGGIIIVIFFLIQLAIGLCLMVGFYMLIVFVAKLGYHTMFGVL